MDVRTSENCQAPTPSNTVAGKRTLLLGVFMCLAAAATHEKEAADDRYRHRIGRVGAWQFSEGAYIHAKARLAQVLLHSLGSHARGRFGR